MTSCASRATPDRAPVVVEPDAEIEIDVVYEDDDVIVVNKSPGVVVHPGPGHSGSTLVHGLIARFPDLRDVGEPERPGLVHRLDRGTSGLMVVARTHDAYVDLVDQLSTHAVERAVHRSGLGPCGAQPRGDRCSDRPVPP